ncbi:hypothetical protein ACN47E_002413 [Coniothyrium glycines]
MPSLSQDLGAIQAPKPAFNPQPLSFPLSRPVYRHDVLSPDIWSIRLLRIHPSRTEVLPVCSLETFPYGAIPPFQALSYRWGAENTHARGHTVLINDTTYKVLPNLFDFMMYYSRIEFREDGSDTYLWIDQICIDQTNVVERNVVVQHMGWIYKHAVRTLSWLGNDPDMVQAAYTYQQSSSDYALCTLLSNQYFSRLWVVQEILLSRESLVLCGYIWLSFVDMYNSAHKNPGMLSRIQRYSPSLHLLYDSLYLRKPKDRHLAHLIDLYSSNGCKDPRDHVYALLGLVLEKERVKIDYAKSIPEVFMDAFRVLLDSKDIPLDEYGRNPGVQMDVALVSCKLAWSMDLWEVRKGSRLEAWRKLYEHVEGNSTDEIIARFSHHIARYLAGHF